MLVVLTHGPGLEDAACLRATVDRGTNSFLEFEALELRDLEWRLALLVIRACVTSVSGRGFQTFAKHVKRAVCLIRIL